MVILGAGAPHRGDVPSALREPSSGTSVLQWQIEASGCRLADTSFVAGYQAEAVRSRFPELSVVENPEWEQTGSGASLLLANIQADFPLLVSYSDILFRASTPEILAATKADIAVAWDSAWKYRYACRAIEDLARCEKVSVSNGQVQRLGPDLQVDWASGEFIGLVYFSPKAVNKLLELRNDFPKSLRQCNLSDYIEYLRGTGLSVAGVDVSGDWAEFDAPRDIAHFILGTKAETLSRLRGMLSGAVILDQVMCTVDEWNNGREMVLDVVWERFAGSPLVVRSSTRKEDSFNASYAGQYDSVLNIETKSGLSAAIDQVISSYGVDAANDQVLIQPMVANAEISGVAFTRTLENRAPWFVVNYETQGDTEAITSGKSSDHKTFYLRRGVERGVCLEPWLDKLISALREIEVLLGYDALDVEFAIDFEGQVYILQVRPISAAGEGASVEDGEYHALLSDAARHWKMLTPAPQHLPGDAPPMFGVMPDWNPAEIIGIAPGALAVSLYRYLIMDSTWAQQRAEYGYRDVHPSPLLVTFSGRPYVDVRASFASFLPKSLPDELAGRLLHFYLEWLRARPELHDKVEFEVVPTCLASGFEHWERRLRAAGSFTVDEIALLRNGLQGITVGAFERCSIDRAQIEALTQRFEKVAANKNLAPLERAMFFLEDCRSLGTLPFAHLARSGFVAVTLLKEAVACGIISREASESFLSTVRTVTHEFSADARDVADGKLDWLEFVARYGHLRPGTYEITSPRYDSNPERFLRPLIAYSREAKSIEPNLRPWLEERSVFFESLHELGLPSEPGKVEAFLRNAIQGREYAKFVFSRNLSAALEVLAEVGQALGLTREELSNLPLGELLALRYPISTNATNAQRLQMRAREFAEARKVSAACELPRLLTSEGELHAFYIGADRPNFVGSSTVIGECLDLGECPDTLAFDIRGKIILIPQADPGYDWLFGQGIAGLVTLYGGANSHMAIRAAEFGLPAAIGVGEQRYRELARARMLELVPGNGVVRVLN